MLLGRPAPSVNDIFVGFQWNIDEPFMAEETMSGNCSFVRYFEANAFSLKHSTPAAIMTITKQKNIVFNKDWHGLSIDRLLYDINHLGTCHYHLKRLWSLLCEELLSVFSKPIIFPKKLSKLKLCATFWKRH